MEFLILDTSSFEKSYMILAQEDRPLAYLPLPSGPDLSKTLATQVQSFVKGRSLQFIALGTGPGSYTGIRVGAALAKALSFGWQIPLIGFCSLIAFAPPEIGAFAILSDARGAGFYALFGSRSLSSLSFTPPELISPSDSRLQTTPILVSPHPAPLSTRLSLPIAATSPDPHFLCPHLRTQFLENPSPPATLIYLNS